MRHLLILVMLAAVPARAATPTPDWPCVQPRQSHLSLGQVWTGPPPPEGAAETPEIAALADRVVQRRMPIEEATAAIDAFAQGTDAETLALLMQAIFHRIDMQRTAILGGISRYGHRQVALAARVEARRARMAELEAAEASPEALAAGKASLEQLMSHLGFVITVEVDAGETSRLNVVGDGDEKEALGALIGREVERLSALQHLVNLMLSK